MILYPKYFIQFQLFFKSTISLEKLGFYKKTFLKINTNLKMVLNKFFLIFNNANMQFAKQKFMQKSYIFIKNILINKKVEIIY